MPFGSINKCFHTSNVVYAPIMLIKQNLHVYSIYQIVLFINSHNMSIVQVTPCVGAYSSILPGSYWDGGGAPMFTLFTYTYVEVGLQCLPCLHIRTWRWGSNFYPVYIYVRGGGAPMFTLSTYTYVEVGLQCLPCLHIRTWRWGSNGYPVYIYIRTLLFFDRTPLLWHRRNGRWVMWVVVVVVVVVV